MRLRLMMRAATGEDDKFACGAMLTKRWQGSNTPDEDKNSVLVPKEAWVAIKRLLSHHLALARGQTYVRTRAGC